MPLHILLADDSVPAQNMGKKILVDAGYEVLAVSNGLEALRRIAEAAPDIAILDIFMPGYTGLEICERLRANPATAALPVILTVGKLEPYRPSDGESVHSNAVIVKPFAAAELVSAVRNLIGEPQPVEVQPVAAAEVPTVEPVADPARENYAGTQVLEPPAPPTAVPPAPPEQPAEGLGEEPPDEPLFSYGDLAAADAAAPLVPPEPSVYAAEPLMEGGEPGGNESLVFNPDAGHTPFSASAADLLPPASQLAGEEDESRFSEFDLEVDATHYAAGPDPEFSTAGEPMQPQPAASGYSELVAEAEPSEAELPAVAPGSAEATGEVSSGALEMPELELPTPQVAEIDPELEVQEAAAPSNIAATREDASQASETIPGGSAPAKEEVAAGASAAQLAVDEEARRLAFEALFNSTEPIPLEEDSTVSAEPTMDALPSIADLSENQSADIAPDSELETLSDDDQSASVVAELDPYLLEEEQPLNAVGKIPDRDPLLDDGSASNWASEQVLEPQDAFAPAAAEAYPLQPAQDSDLNAAAPVDAVEVEAAQPLAEASPEAAEVLEVAAATESAPTLPEAVPEAAPAADEAIELEVAGVEAAQPTAEASPEALEVLEVAAATESAPTLPEAVPEAAPAADEAIELEVAGVEAAQPTAEASPEALEILEVAPATESAPTAPEVVAEPAPVADEAIELEVAGVGAAQPSAEASPEVLGVLEVAPATESAPTAPEVVAEPAPAVDEAIELEVAGVESAQPSVEPSPEALEVLEVAPAAESAPTVPEVTAEPAPAADEAIELEGAGVESAQPSAEASPEAAEVLEVAPATESAPTVPEVTAEPAPETAPAAVEAAPEAVQDEPQPGPEQAPVAQEPAEVAHPAAATQVQAIPSAPEVSPRSSEAERIHQAVERVFDRFKPVLVAAIVRELARRD